MKKFLFITLCCFAGIATNAQTTRIIRGAVIDKNGNPIPGATVEATGGAESTVVDADGTFSMEIPVWLKTITIQYEGMQPQKINTNYDNIVCKMKPIPTHQWFINVQGGFSSTDDHTDIKYINMGVMVGKIGKLGYYGKLLLTTMTDGVVGFSALTAGVTKQVSPILHVYAGTGYGKINLCTIDEFSYNYESCAGFAFDMGFIIKPVNHVSVNFGTTIRTDFGDNGNWALSAGVGYVF